MFSKILKSRARRHLFEIFLKDSRQKYYLRELANMLQYSAGSLQRELTSLEQDELLVSEKIGNMKFFSLNKKSPLIAGLRKIIESSPPEPLKIPVKHTKKESKKPVLKPETLENSPDEPLRMHIG